MTPTLDMHKNISRRVENKLAKFCAPLIDHLEISHFYHYILTNEGHFAALGLNQGWHECLFADPELGVLPLPYFYHNREKLKGIIFTQTLPYNKWENLAQVASHDFGVNLGLQFTDTHSWGMEGLGFGLKTYDPLQHMALLNELPLLQLFIKEYRKEIQKNILQENLIDVASLIGPSFFEIPDKPAPNLREIVLGKMKIKFENPFTKRESEVIKLLLEGYTAPQIAEQLFRSKRTIEHHIERIKDKLDCSSKYDLIQKLREQLPSFVF
jgi:DNA-binding CsgD family transcriptional regulator